MIRHVAGIAEIVEDIEVAVRFYRQVLGLTVRYQGGSGYAEVDVPGILHFGIWSRAQAAQATFGDSEAAHRIPLGFTIGFEVDEVAAASGAISAGGGVIEQPPKREPWGQITSRFFSPSGALCEVSETPEARHITREMQAGPES